MPAPAPGRIAALDPQPRRLGPDQHERDRKLDPPFLVEVAGLIDRPVDVAIDPDLGGRGRKDWPHLEPKRRDGNVELVPRANILVAGVEDHVQKVAVDPEPHDAELFENAQLPERRFIREKPESAQRFSV